MKNKRSAGQGEVYKVMAGNRCYPLKWYVLKWVRCRKNDKLS